MSTLRALWRLNQKSYVQFDQIEKMCHFTLYNFVFMQIFVGATVKALWFFKKIMFVHFFFLHENRDVHLAGVMEAKPEELCTIWPNRKDVPFYALQVCIHANFLSVQLLRRYEFLKK